MIANEVGAPGYIPHYLWKLLIDESYQRGGYGTATLDLICRALQEQSRSRCDMDERRQG